MGLQSNSLEMLPPNLISTFGQIIFSASPLRTGKHRLCRLSERRRNLRGLGPKAAASCCEIDDVERQEKTVTTAAETPRLGTFHDDEVVGAAPHPATAAETPRLGTFHDDDVVGAAPYPATFPSSPRKRRPGPVPLHTATPESRDYGANGGHGRGISIAPINRNVRLSRDAHGALGQRGG